MRSKDLTIRVLISALLVGVPGFVAQDVSPLPDSEIARFDEVLEKRASLDYLVTLPEGYEDGDREWPLLLFLHGAGERGNDLTKVAVHGPPKLIANGTRTFKAVVVSPQCPEGSWWNYQPLTELVEHLEKTYRLDPDRLYVTGLSMGGYGTWDLAFRNPDKFAAIAPVCGGGVRFGPRAIPHLPVWAFHGGKDGVVPPSESETLVDLLKEKGSTTVQLTIYPEAGHDSWTAAYEEPKLWEWIFAQRKSNNASPETKK